MDSIDDVEFMRSLLAASDDCIKVIGLDGKLEFMSEGGQRTMEVSDFNAIKGCPWPDFWEGQGNLDASLAIQEASQGRSSRFSGMANTAAGTPKFWDVQVSPIRSRDGVVRAILSVSRDITVLKQLEERQRLLALEINHRLKNVIAMIQAIANQTIRGTLSADDARNAFTARLAVLGSAQDAVINSGDMSADLNTVVRDALRAHCTPDRFIVQGAAVRLPSQAAFAMALALHELATNAVKYGALSIDSGLLRIEWRVEGNQFVFEWKELGGPEVTEPGSRGFGSRMIERALPAYFHGETRVSYDPDGVRFVLNAPTALLSVK